MFDDFRNDQPDDYLAGFPWHPHRGIETITYVLAGSVDHGDSLGNQGTLGAGDVQWMTAGSGILHQEMPQGDPQGRMHGFQLWANLPSSLKMTAPRYQDVPAAESRRSSTTTARACASCAAISGASAGRSTASPPIRATSTSSSRRAGARPCRSRPTRHAFAYVFEGSGTFRDASEPFGVLTEKDGGRRDPGARADRQPLAGAVRHAATKSPCRPASTGIRFLLVSGKPLEEPVAWYGPIVMNTQAELRQALADLRDGTFIRQR